ncbi:factor-independent urate hydroxylase [Deinococcus multiflagellatus]|uniref:factor independent urate hydroxylase n=1 Tax=Deinococcus multiflagellatus TaxID=1656887 RepID=A0ABW1ZUF9_9DEIO|nr:urate oxidase [Deinococcus multiflagellatus]MBZ9713532.1 urate oxidase [Deinococcus multiflagellatus]
MNALSPEDFAAHFAGVLEHSPHYAAQVAAGRPYRSAEAVAQAFAQAAQAGSPEAQLALIRAHPDLAGKAALAGDLTPESTREQASAGLDRLSPDEYAEFQALNAAYHARFAMPYVVCVREHTKASIFEGARRRLTHSPEQERAAALHEIGRIARLRVLDLIQPGGAPAPTSQEEPAMTVKVKLGENNYGKADVRLFKVFRDGPRHDIKDMQVRVAVTGDFDAAHTDGDNTGLVATDTMRNTVYALARDGLTGSIEAFGKHLITHFVTQGPRVQGARVTFTQHTWARMVSGGQPHDHAFVRQMPKHTATVWGDGQTFTVESGLEELYILKTTQSGWAGFHRDAYTTLPDTEDRILATVVSARWTYAVADCDYDAVWTAVYEALLDTFPDHYSPSMQHTLYRIGEAVLTRCPEIERIHFSFPNRHHILYPLERYGLDNPGTIFHADAEPYGVIEGWVERA